MSEGENEIIGTNKVVLEGVGPSGTALDSVGFLDAAVDGEPAHFQSGFSKGFGDLGDGVSFSKIKNLDLPSTVSPKSLLELYCDSMLEAAIGEKSLDTHPKSDNQSMGMLLEEDRNIFIGTLHLPVGDSLPQRASGSRPEDMGTGVDLLANVSATVVIGKNIEACCLSKPPRIGDRSPSINVLSVSGSEETNDSISGGNSADASHSITVGSGGVRFVRIVALKDDEGNWLNDESCKEDQ
ncbi:hypothetical protein COLO4_03472 [Corchorus olitorius]|uniref:Uncharacterized protein n=1 Tax=Corchorus olitorius TaxID=93759 RepID=A0A1R3KYI9_9ROSI|nr:hypothetical protein COLO4_03472 [Corchorus olitorius]